MDAAISQVEEERGGHFLVTESLPETQCVCCSELEHHSKDVQSGALAEIHQGRPTGSSDVQGHPFIRWPLGE